MSSSHVSASHDPEEAVLEMMGHINANDFNGARAYTVSSSERDSRAAELADLDRVLQARYDGSRKDIRMEFSDIGLVSRSTDGFEKSCSVDIVSGFLRIFEEREGFWKEIRRLDFGKSIFLGIPLKTSGDEWRIEIPLSFLLFSLENHATGGWTDSLNRTLR